MSDIAKLIDDSIAAVMNEGVVDKAKEVISDLKSGKAAEIVYDKLNPDKPDFKFETIKKLAKKNRELEGMGAKEHLAKAGEKAIGATKEAAGDVKDKVVAAGKKAAEVAEDVKDKAVAAGKKAVAGADDMDIKGHLVSAGKKAVEAAKEKADELKDTVREHPGLAAATAAGLAAGIGGLAAVKRMRKAAKK